MAHNIFDPYFYDSCNIPWSACILSYHHLAFCSTDCCKYCTLQISTYVLRAVSVPGLTPSQRVEVTAQGAMVFKRAGLSRKYGLLLYMAGLMSAESCNVQVGSLCVCFLIRDYFYVKCFLCWSHDIVQYKFNMNNWIMVLWETGL